MEYGISKYPDVDQVYKKLYNLLNQPLRKIKKEKMDEYLNYFETKCIKSKNLHQQAKNLFQEEFNIILLLTIHFQSRSKRQKEHIFGMLMEIDI